MSHRPNVPDVDEPHSERLAATARIRAGGPKYQGDIALGGNEQGI